MDYEIYHDESNELGFWHGLLFLPEESKQEVFGFLKKIREKNGYKEDKKLNFKSLKREGKQFYAILMSLNLFKLINKSKFLTSKSKISDCDAIQHCYVKNGRKYYEALLQIKKKYNIKFALLKERDRLETMERYPDHAAKIETTFRFALKGGAHFMFDKNNPINIKKIYFDGHKQYHRNIDSKRIIKNLSSELREYCKIDENFEVDDRQIKDRENSSFIIMNFIDNIISAWRCLISNQYNNKFQEKVVMPLEDLYYRWSDGNIFSNKNSRWHKSFSLSECYLKEDIASNKIWFFDNIRIDKKDGKLPFN